jgi:hypothetical protein
MSRITDHCAALKEFSYPVPIMYFASKLTYGIVPNLCPCEDTEINSRHKRGSKKESDEGNKIAFHNNIFPFPS